MHGTEIMHHTHLVVIHDSVHGLDPHGVNISVEDDPLVCLVLVETLRESRNDTAHAVLSRVAIHFVGTLQQAKRNHEMLGHGPANRHFVEV